MGRGPKMGVANFEKRKKYEENFFFEHLFF
jgi:hypothetical protein